ncbi:Fructokinase [Olavius algarvensis spirochete endosymbiont]|uniref:carbohydrate kinase family protein n=1 Tax=Olavius algarvensis spirochete endosymbiont TaxID=260710 RepID=UPI000F2C3ED2|nr:carbohydrate kinase [Olavius algarvensis spirochete endosymbiont]VDA99509.1 Fructokinase [Olavius algarvensis spirochete endosymbiont]
MIVSCGEALIDFVPREGDELTYAPCTGGSSYNLAIAVSRLGAEAGFFGKISSDFFGNLLFNRLLAERVDTSLICRSDRLTTLAFVGIEQGKEPRYAFYTHDSADRHLLDVPASFSDEVECLEFGSISLLLEPGARTIRNLIRREVGRRALSYDPNIRSMMVSDVEAFRRETEELATLATIVKVSGADLDWLYPGRNREDSARAWLAAGAGIVVVTRGKNGAVLLTPGFRVESGEYPVEVIDTVGAGDSFHGALLVRLSQLGRLSMRCGEVLTRAEALDALKFAIKASSLNCARRGADPPTMDDMAQAE